MRVMPFLNLFFIFSIAFFVILFFYFKVNDLAFLIFMFIGLSPFYIPFIYGHFDQPAVLRRAS